MDERWPRMIGRNHRHSPCRTPNFEKDLEDQDTRLLEDSNTLKKYRHETTIPSSSVTNGSG